MFRTMLVSVLVASAGAGRIQVHDDGTKSEAKFGASCEHLQTVFHNRVGAFQASLDVSQDLDAISRTAQIRTMMRTYGIIRTLRRARTCSWVIENDSDDLEQMRGIVQTLLAGNPCAEVARTELEAGVSAETAEVEMQSISRAMSVLASDNCEVVESPEQTVNLDNDAAVDAQLSETEDEMQDVIEELESQEGEGSFIQTDSNAGTFRGFMRAVGVVFLMLFLLLACVGVLAVIGFWIVFMLSQLMIPEAGRGQYAGLTWVVHGLLGGAAVGAVGIAPCSYQLYTQLLPRLN